MIPLEWNVSHRVTPSVITIACSDKSLIKTGICSFIKKSHACLRSLMSLFICSSYRLYLSLKYFLINPNCHVYFSYLWINMTVLKLNLIYTLSANFTIGWNKFGLNLISNSFGFNELICLHAFSIICLPVVFSSTL